MRCPLKTISVAVMIPFLLLDPVENTLMLEGVTRDPCLDGNGLGDVVGLRGGFW